MSQDFRSSNWYRVAGVRARLAPQVRVQRQSFRGSAWYLLFDPIQQRTLRLTPAAWHVVSRMDGRHTVEALWRDSTDTLGAQAAPQDELIQLLAQLHENDLLLSDTMPDLDELLRRRDRQRRQRWKRSLANPLSIKLPLWDPDAFLTRTLPAVRWVFGPVGAALWLLVVGAGLLLFAMHGDEVAGDIGTRLLSAASLLTLLVVYPLVKGLHELAHAYAAKAGGAAVHELGLMFLVFAPVPYVDASGSTAFRDKRQRALVAAAGMAMELALAALALFVWLLVEPGVVRSLAMSVMFVGGVSTLVFNGNPLMRYDGYYLLCDLIEVPNLAQRSNAWWIYLVKRHVFGLAQARPPHAGRGEPAWFTLYAPLSLAWRVSVTAGIALYLGQEYLQIGLGIGLWGLVTLLIWPLLKGLRYVAASAELQGRRRRPVFATAGLTLLLLALLLAVPMPMSTYAQGQVWPADSAQLRPLESGWVAALAVPTGASVHQGQPVIELDNDQIRTDAAATSAQEERQHRSYVAQLAAVGAEDDVGHGRVAALVQQDAWRRADDERRHAQDRAGRLLLVAGRDGVLQLPRPADLPGRWLKKGEMVGYVQTGEPPIVRVVVTQDDIDLVRQRLTGARVRLSGDLATVWPAQVLREVPGGGDRLPSAALTLDGGGLIAADGRDAEQPRAVHRVFQFDLLLPAEAALAAVGERAHVRFEHPGEPAAMQAWRRLRQLLLSQLAL